MLLKAKIKRLPKGQRTHIRRLKQETRKEGNTYTFPKRRRAPEKPAA